MMRPVLAALLAVSLAACGGESATEPPPPPDGPLAFGVVSGQNQTVQAGRDSLTKPVVVALVRTASGRLVTSIVGRGAGGVDAQTIVTGSPVPGAVICAHPDSLHPLVPWVQCTNTDSTGHAPMWFNPGTRAGHPSAEIRGTLNGEPAVFDTVVATVLPGPAATLSLSAHRVAVFAGQSYNWRSLVSNAADSYGNAVATDSAAIAGDTVLAHESTGHVRYALGQAADSVTVTALDDLSGLTWTLTTRCVQSTGDTSTVVLRSTASTYATTLPAVDADSADIALTVPGSTWNEVTQLGGDSVAYAAQGTTEHQRVGVAVLTDTTGGVRTYTGGTWCDQPQNAVGQVVITAAR